MLFLRPSDYFSRNFLRSPAAGVSSFFRILILTELIAISLFLARLAIVNQTPPACDCSSFTKQGGDKNVSIWDKTNVSMDDPELVSAVRQMLIPPSISKTKLKEREYMKAGFNPSAGQVQLIENILISFGKDGFFIECGANDGEWYSNTLWLERTLNWKGLLIEADPVAFRKLKGKNRNAWTLNMCLASTKSPKRLPFFQTGGVMGGLIKPKHHFPDPVQVQCVPFYTILLAVDRTVIDFFSLDIEGTELDVLRTIPFDKVFIKVLAIEHILIKEGKEALRKFMESHGYRFFTQFVHPRGLAGDSIFIHSSLIYNETSKVT
ncbi:unnamed protein product [Allacma fusca]|uniref:Methyltransferase FkbM domain-containing protein n=1 Tax=Allacma fusca TaxID=39272 RepID=A0A8J2KGR5_9HEXA|nr:unnamed protein product [Allacma fusca]